MTISFKELGIPDDIVKAMEDMGWTEPTPIQIEAIPQGLKGRDMLAQAQTGTGKTGTYGSIVLGTVKAGMNLPTTLVLAPTRELASQVAGEIDKLSKYTGHRCLPIYGGANIETQINKLRKGTDIIIGTPGRLKDLIQRRDLDLSKVSTVIFDEADRMLDMGFARDMDFIMKYVPRKRQTMLFSATMSEDIKKLALRQLSNPLEILVSKDEPVLELIRQYYMIVTKDEKRDMVHYFLEKEPMKTIIFCHTKYRVDQVMRKFQNSYSMGAIHGNHAQNRRERTIKSFKEDEISILVATDIAARGLDIDNVARVINMDMPTEPETYVHRIGRTGRAGKEGIAISFVMPEETDMIRAIKRNTGKDIEEMERPEGIVFETRPAVRDVQQPSARATGPAGGNRSARMPMGVIEINIGAKDRCGRADIFEFIKSSTGLENRSVGVIDMGESFSTIEIEGGQVDKTVMDLTGCTFNDKPVVATVSGNAPRQQVQRTSAPRRSGPPGGGQRRSTSPRTSSGSGKDQSPERKKMVPSNKPRSKRTSQF